MNLAPPGRARRRRAAPLPASELVALADVPPLWLFQQVAGSPKGLTEAEASRRLVSAGENDVDATPVPPWPAQLFAAAASPFVALLLVLAAVLAIVRDARGAAIVGVMVLLSVLLRFRQEYRSHRAAARLRALVTTTATVRRRATDGDAPTDREAPLEDLVPGDLVLLGPGDLVPADLRLLTANDLLVDQAPLSGETLPMRKHEPTGNGTPRAADADPLDEPSLCLAGTMVVGGTATAVVVATGRGTYFGSLARTLSARRPDTTFDRGVRSVGWTLIRFMLVLTPVVLAINGLTRGDWFEAFLFAVSVAVGLTPEMLPVIVTTNLAKGAQFMSRRKVITKRLNAIQDLGAMDVLCTDKTGTLTENRIVLAQSLDAAGRFDDEALEYAYVHGLFQSTPASQLDEAVRDHLDPAQAVVVEARFRHLAEIPFDHERRYSTVVVTMAKDAHLLIAKGDPDTVLTRCAHVRVDGEIAPLTDALRREALEVVKANNRHGMRVLAVAAKESPARLGGYRRADERDLVLVGFVSFLDPPKDSAGAALASLAEHGVTVKVVTGDNRLVAARVCREVGLEPGEVVSGPEIDRLDDAELAALARRTKVFAKVGPAQKARIVRALRAGGHTVGFLADGTNDAAALREADVGISVDSAVDIARHAADIILLEKDLTVLAHGVVEGRRTLGNTMKYVKITASSNFGNVLSVVAASAFLPFLPMLPSQLLAQNLIYDVAQLALPWDRVDAEYLRRPRRWSGGDLARFMVVFGPVSSLFDLATFAVLWWVLGANSVDQQALFQSGWFMEGLLSQALVVLVIRTRSVPFLRGRPSWPVALMIVGVAAAALFLPFGPLAPTLRMQPLPLSYFPWLLGILLTYCCLAQLIKTAYVRVTGAWL
ncbi:magnesium-translocating P-type ATPase [Solihabitans fulvus]|uniref:Magnesium-transporting ATPase, P-type 1 n=1 Tax=Solihabitans fulvus TaxID=1892852 RepID=A0A5B2WNX4_9PSEU|nr:magnesium-translocating P-type ATPase [Solihabitans fulvus]KAA2252704.1 magnesium-translocating P-type ATPase [Solihabitans fulvus]